MSIKEMFSADDPVDLFVLSMSMARNDIEHGLRLVGDANSEDRPEFGYHLRVVLAHFFDAARALCLWKQESPGVRDILALLPAEGQKALKKVISTEQRLGKGALEHNRVNTFHYPAPDPAYRKDGSDAALANTLRALGDEPASILQIDGGKRLRLAFADDAAMSLAMQKFEREDVEGFRLQQETARDGATAFVNFVDHLLPVFIRERGLGFETTGGSKQPGR